VTPLLQKRRFLIDVCS